MAVVRTSSRRRAGVVRRRRLLALVLLASVILACLLSLRGGAPRASALSGSGEPTPQTDASVPAERVTMIGATPLEQANETWGIGQTNEGSGALSWVLVRYDGSDWSIGSALLDSSGTPLSGFEPDKPKGDSATSPLAGQMTPAGAGVLVGTVPSAGGRERVILLRDVGGSFREVSPPPLAAQAQPGTAVTLEGYEHLFGVARAPLIAPLDEADGHAGALVVPVDEPSAAETGSPVDGSVLHWDGNAWTREPIAIPAASSSSFRVLAIGASSPTNAWLLGQLGGSSYPPGAVALFRREPLTPGGPSWQPVAPEAGTVAGDPLTVPVHTVQPAAKATEPFTVAGTGDSPTVLNQLLTVTSEGVWIDGLRSDISAPTTLYFKLEGSGGEKISGSWCKLPSGTAVGTPECEQALPEPLPSGPSRSIAWTDPANPAGFGQRVIAGLPEGVTLRLDGSSFTRVLALGASPAPNDVGGTFGSAFSSPREGWLGNSRLPVHLTLDPVPSRLIAYPVPFRHTLVSIAPQPNAPIGAGSSQALAVGDQGQVARYVPGKGWLPESLQSIGGRRATPRLRAVAWPTPSRAYAVGDHGQMWRWEAETNLWESDPTAPFNFRGNLTGVAFDPHEPSCGVVVGEEGVLLDFGKSWTQQPLPEGLSKPTFTSVAFAGDEAFVAYHELPDPSTNVYVGGLLKATCQSDGQLSAWEVDSAAATAIGANVPWAVAGLPDGGAAFGAGERSGDGDGGILFERQAAGAPWQATATPFPGGIEPGALALFREGGALRVIASGSVPDTYSLESQTPPPPGFPPNLLAPYPLSAGYGAGHIVLQTASGWSDQEHELNNVQEPAGNYSFYDMVYQPDPVSAVLIDPTGKEGWAVGGFVDSADSDGALDTAYVGRYPADGVPPPGRATVAIPDDPKNAIFAIGGGAQCAAPCADRERARVGPDVWLFSALTRSAQLPGVRDFLYTGPRLTTGATSGPATLAIPYERELQSYAGLLAAGPVKAYAAASTNDLVGGDATLFRDAFSADTTFASSSEPQAAYYAFESDGGNAGEKTRVIVLSAGTDVSEQELAWLKEQLANAAGAQEPAIVVGNADLGAPIQEHNIFAERVAQTLIEGEASAYFYDAPEENVKRTLALPGVAGKLETFGSGTLGYVNHVAEDSGAFLGASGFLDVEINTDPKSRNAEGRFPIAVKLIPNIEELALEAKDGTLLRRSQSALFVGLARRPRAGNRSQNQVGRPDTDPYIPIPSNCVGSACAEALLPSYSFSSSNKNIGDFVQRNKASADPHAVLLEHEEPLPDPEEGLFCAYNSGTITVTVSAGGLAASLPVTIQAGSVERPCGTHKLEPSEIATRSPAPAAPPPPLAPSPAPAAAPPGPSPLPPLLVPPLPAVPARAAITAPFIPAAAVLLPPSLFVPPPLPTVGRPAPPSGSSSVEASSSVFQTEPIAQEERDEEEAIESASAEASARNPAEDEPLPLYLAGVLLLAAFAGATTIRRRPRRGRRELKVAPATLTTIRAQRRLARHTTTRGRWI